MPNNVSKVVVHPASLKYLQKGHPWVTLDSYSKKFPNNPFLITHGPQSSFLLLHDPQHKKIKARLWSSKKNLTTDFQPPIFLSQLGERLKSAISKRKILKTSHSSIFNRENLYLFFAEADFIPGLQGLLLGQRFILQDFTKTIWMPYLDFIFSQVKQLTADILKLEIKEVFYQQRPGPFLSYPAKNNAKSTAFEINEYGVRYALNFALGQDPGLYTDMSSVRFHTAALYNQARVLNLFSYTGAFSLFALAQGAREVTSVDLSPKYMAILNENLARNPQLNSGLHHALVGPVLNKIKELVASKKIFDIIICDPPSASSDGQSRHNHWKSVGDLITLIDPLHAPDGRLVIFNNTHQLTRAKFEQDLGKIPALKKYISSQSLGLDFDCPRLPHFPEGDYLKGMVLRKKK